jgi:glycosyltransferase involved in cell wall biosynthesis
MEKMITIFTPTYNRAKQLHRLYESLLAQASYDFEWLIIDDGSTDDTSAVVQSFDQAKFKITYYKQPNGGKHRAYNRALEMAGGEYFFCLDSDDWLARDAVKTLAEQLSGPFTLAYKEDETGKRLSSPFPDGVERVSLGRLGGEYHCGGEFTILFQTEFARKYPFPVFEGENFVTESVVYDRMAAEEEAALLPCVITICEYQADGLSNRLNQIMKANPAGYCLYFMQRIDLQESAKERLIVSGKYHCFRIFAGKKRSEYCGKHSGIVAVAKPVGLLFWLYYKFVRGF